MSSSENETVQDPTLHLPRILCLHGGGTNSRIFRAQCRGLNAQLSEHFRLVFAEAVFPCAPGPDVLSVYKDWGVFKRWLRWKPDHPNPGAEVIVEKLDQSIETAMLLDDMRGATGEWTGLLGFSQGAKVCASLLYRQQRQEQIHGKGNTSTSFRFGVLLAGRAPLICLDPETDPYNELPDAAQITDVTDFLPPDLDNGGNLLSMPTLHVHGTQDPGLQLHRQLYHEFCDPRTRRLVVWDGNHRVPLKRNDVGRVVKEILEMAEKI